MESLVGDDCFRKLDNIQYLIFYFTASWCKPCQSIHDELVNLSKTFDPNHIIIYKIDIDEDDNTEICEKCQVNSVPTFLLFKNRSLLSKTSGANVQNVKDMINNYCK